VRALPSPYARIPAIALTAYAGEVNVRKSELSGFQGHLSKPVDPTVLVSTIASVGRPPGAA
jgi:CheY-like chemotaxis protein